MPSRKKIDLTEVAKKGMVAAILEIGFILFVGAYAIVSEGLFHPGSKSMIFGIASVLILLVTGVALSGLLILGYPAYYFLQKEYKAGIVFWGASLSTLITFFILIILGEVFIY